MTEPYSYTNPAPKKPGQPGNPVRGKRGSPRRAPAPPAPKPAQPAVVVADPYAPVDMVAAATRAYNEAKSPSQRARALTMLSAAKRFHGDTVQTDELDSTAAARPAGARGAGFGTPSLTPAQVLEFLDACEAQNAPEPDDWAAFLDAADLAPETPWQPANLNNETVQDATDYSREVVLDRIAASLAG